MSDERNSVEAARDRIERHRQAVRDTRLPADVRGLRTQIINIFETILWVALILGVLGALWSLLTFNISGAVMGFVTTIVSVGVGFVALDIRDKLMDR